MKDETDLKIAFHREERIEGIEHLTVIKNQRKGALGVALAQISADPVNERLRVFRTFGQRDDQVVLLFIEQAFK